MKNLQKEYYIKILKEGKDNRGVGLVWALHALVDLGFSIKEEWLPDTIDSDSKKFLIYFVGVDKKHQQLIQEYRDFKKKQ